MEEGKVEMAARKPKTFLRCRIQSPSKGGRNSGRDRRNSGNEGRNSAAPSSQPLRRMEAMEHRFHPDGASG